MLMNVIKVLRKHLLFKDSYKKSVHLNDYKFKINHKNCDKYFVSNLIQHKKAYIWGEKPFVCHYNDCNKSFTTKIEFELS